MALTRLPGFTVDSTSSFTFANANVTANVVAGNIKTDNLLYANGAAWTFTGTYSNSNVASYLPTYTGNITGNIVTLTGNVSAINANLGNLVVANYYSGSGNLLSNIQAANITGTVANANYAAYAGNITVAAQPNITSVGTLTTVTTSGDGTIGGNLTITGNLTVSGTTTTVNSTTVNINDINIVLANNATTAAQANGAGITINGASANILYNSTSNAFTFSHPISADGNLLANITGANVTGTVANATYATTAGTAGTVTTAAQPNITSVGNLVNLQFNNTVTPLVSTAPGQMFWDTDNHTISVGMENGVTQQLGLEQYVYVKASAAITNGQVVMFAGANGANLLGAPADSTSAGFKPEYIIGIATQSIALNSFGYITVFGLVHDVNTNGWTVGDILWLDNTTPGRLTNVQPSDPNFQIQMAAVTKQGGGDGHIMVRPTNFYGIERATNVKINGVSAGQALVYDGANSVWINGTPNVANYAGTVTTNAQPNITSIGTLSGLTSTGVIDLTTTSNISLGTVSNVHIAGGTTGQYLKTDGAGNLSWDTVTGGSGGGSSITYTAATTPPGTANVADQWFNTATNTLYEYMNDGSASYWVDIQTPTVATTQYQTTQLGFNNRTYTGNGSQVDFIVSVNLNSSSVIVVIDGVIQTPTTDYSITNAVLTFTTAPYNGATIQIRELGSQTPYVLANLNSVVGFNTNTLTVAGNATAANLSTTNNITTNTLAVSSNASISGNLNVTGTITNTGLKAQTLLMAIIFGG